MTPVALEAKTWREREALWMKSAVHGVRTNRPIVTERCIEAADIAGEIATLIERFNEITARLP